MHVAALAERIVQAPFTGRRRMVALVGPPASGKSTLSDTLPSLVARSQVVPMDGFHLDNAVLADRGLIARKGAPETFDVAGLAHLLRRLTLEDTVVFPKFDRRLDKSIAGAGVVGAEVETVIVEGNYLLLDRPVWREMAKIWDVSILLTAPEDVLKARLVSRWQGLGVPQAEIMRKVDGNDLPNARVVLGESVAADVTLPFAGRS